MSASDYNPLLPDAAQPIDDDVLKAVDSVIAERNQLKQQDAWAGNLADVRAREDSSNRVEALQITQRTGIPVDTVERNLTKVRAQDAVQRIDPRRISQSKVTREFLYGDQGSLAMSDPDGFRELIDSIPMSQSTTDLGDVGSAGYEQGLYVINTGTYGFRELTQSPFRTPEDTARWHELRNNPPPPVPQMPGPVDDVVAKLVEQAPIMGSLLTFAAGGAAMGATLGGVGGSFSGAGVLPGAGGGALLGAPAGVAVGSFQLESGNAYAEYLRMAEEIHRTDGIRVPDSSVRGAALLVGALNAAMEVGGMGLIYRILGLKGLQQRLTSKGVKEILKSRSLRPHLSRLAKRLAQSAAVEGSTEIVQESIQAFGGHLLLAHHDPKTFSFEVPSAETLMRLGEAGLWGFVVGGVYSAPFSALVTSAEVVASGRRAKQQAVFLDKLVDTSNGELGTKLRDADAAGFRRWIQGMVEESLGDTNLYIDANKLTEYFQEKNIDPESLRDVIPEVLDQLPLAMASGADVVIPVSDYATYLGPLHEGLKPHVRHGLNAKSPAEADETAAEAEAELEAELERLADLREEGVEPTVGERIEQTILQRFVSEGIYSPRDARWQALLYRSAIETRIERKLRGERKRLGRDLTQEEIDVITEEVAIQSLFQPVGPEGAGPRPTLEQALERIGIDTMLNELRRGIQPELSGLKQYPILDELKRQGGVRPGSTLADELHSMGITAKTMPGLYNKNGAGALDAFDFTESGLLLSAREEGAFGRVDETVLMDAIDAEYRLGSPLRTEEEMERIQERQVPREQLKRFLDDLGIDLQTKTNEEVADLLAEHYRATTTAEAPVSEDTEELYQQSLAQGWTAETMTPEQSVALDRYVDSRPDALEIREQFTLHAGTPWLNQAMYGAITRQHLEDLLAGRDVDYESGLSHPRYPKLAQAAAKGPESLWAYLETNSFIGHAGKPINSVNSTFLNCRPSLDCARFCYATQGNYRYDPTVFKAELVNWAIESDPIRAARIASRQYKATAEFLLDKALRLNDKGDLGYEWLPFIEELNNQGVRVQVFSKRPDILRQVPEMNLRLLSVDDTNSQQMAADNPDLMLAVVYQGQQDIPFLEQYADRVQVILPVKHGQRLLSKEETAPIPKDLKKHICPVEGFGKKVGKTADGKWNCTKCDKNAGIGCFVSTSTKSVMDQLEKDIRNEPEELQARLDEITELAGTLDGEARQRLLGRVDLLVSAIRRGVDLEAAEGVIADDESASVGERLDPVTLKPLTTLEQSAVDREPWVRGERAENVGGDLFFSLDSEIAENFGEVRPIAPGEYPRNPLRVNSKEELAELIGYEGDPQAESIHLPVDHRFDTMAKRYAQERGHDAIAYENGTFDAPELHLFRETIAPTTLAAEGALDRIWNPGSRLGGEETIGEWLDRHGVERTDDGRFVFYHATPTEGGATTSIRAGSQLETDPESASSFATGTHGVARDQVTVHKLYLTPDEIAGGHFGSLRKDVDIAAATSPTPRAAPTTLEQAQVPEAERPMGGVYYSALGRALRTSKQRKMTVQQLRKLLQKQSVKADEIVWTGLDEYLEGMDSQDKVDLDALLEQISLIQVEEEVRVHDEFSEYTLPGGENYTVTLITLPPIHHTADIEARIDSLEKGKEFAEGADWDEMDAEVQRLKALRKQDRLFTGGHFGEVAPNILVHVRWNERTGPNGEKILFIEEIQDDWAKAGRKEGYAGVFPQEVVDAAVAGGMTEEAAVADVRHLMESPLDTEDRPTRDEWARLISATEDSVIDLNEVFHDRREGVPDRPFKASGASSMLAFKRMVAHAAKNGFDSVAWTTGKIQVDRYEGPLRQVVDEIKWEPVTPPPVPAGEVFSVRENEEGMWEILHSDGSIAEMAYTQQEAEDAAVQFGRGEVAATPGGGSRVGRVVGNIAVFTNKDGVTTLDLQVDPSTGLITDGPSDAVGEPLEDVFPKNIAKQILESEEGSISGKEITIGGKGFEDLYDKTLVKGANKLGKQFGTKVERFDLESGDLAFDEIRSREEEAFFNLAEGIAVEMGLGDEDSRALASDWIAEWDGVGEDAADAQAPRAAAEYRSSLIIKDHTVHSLPITDKLRASVEEEGLPLFQAAAEGPRGSLQFSPDLSQIVMRFSEARDLSTGLHEMGHLFFEMMMQDVRLEGADPALVADMQTALEFLGVSSLEEVGVEQHETWARAFEAYLREGKAPSAELQRAFDRFKVWLVNIYRSILQLDVELTPEIRGVFDRMLATEEQIAQFQAEQRMQPKFESAESAGMTAEEFAQYQADYERMLSRAEAKTLARTLAEGKRELKKRWKSEYQKVRAQAEADINSQPAYRLRHWLQMGVLLDEETPENLEHVRLDRDILVRMHGEEILKVLGGSGKYSMWQKDGIGPDAMAELFGFISGDALVRALADTINRKKAIKQEADQRMKEIHGDILNDGTLSELALEAMESDDKGHWLAREMRILAARSGLPGTPQSTARQIARRMIAEKRVRDLRPDIFRRAEQRAAREVLDAVEAQDWERAHRAGLQQLLSHFLVVESTQRKDQAAKWHTYLRGFDDKKKIERIAKAGEDYLDEIFAILDRFDFRKISDKQADRRTSLAAWIQEKEAEDETLSFAIDDKLRDESFRTPWRNMTVEELESVVDAVKNIEHVALFKRKLLLAKEKRKFEATVSGVVDKIVKNRRTDKPIPIEQSLRDWAKEAVGSYYASHRKFASLMHEMDGGPGGIMFETFTRTMDEQGAWETEERVKAGKRLEKLFEIYTDVSMKEKMKAGATKATLGFVEKVRPEITVPRLVPGTDIELSHMGRLMAVLNMGNEGNRQRLRDGYGWTESDLAAIVNTLSKEDMDFVQGVWDFIDEYWDLVAAKEKRVRGVAPKRVERQALQTRHGEYAGGYFPIVGDPRQSARAHADLVSDEANLTKRGARASASTRRGHTKERADKVMDTKIRLDVGVIFEHVSGVVHDLAWHEWLIDTNKLLSDKRISGAIIQGYGNPVYRTLLKALEDIAAGDIPAEKGWEQSVNWLRTGGSVAAMGFNVLTAALQPYGLFQSMVSLRGDGPVTDYKWVFIGISKWWRGPESVEKTGEWIYSRSTFMKNRGLTMQREIREIQTALVYGGGYSDRKAAYFYLIAKAQLLVDIPTWLGAYEKEMQVGSGDEKRAISMADRAVKDSQGSGEIQDLAAIQRGGPLLKAWTAFYHFFNTTLNLTAQSYRRTDFKSITSVGRLAADMLMLYSFPAVLSDLMRKWIMDDLDDDESLAETIVRSHAGYMLGTQVGPRELSGFASGFTDYEGPAGTRFFSAISRAGVQVSQGELDRANLKAINQVGGIVFHYPAIFVQRFFEGSFAVYEGETKNPVRLLTGPTKEQRQ